MKVYIGSDSREPLSYVAAKRSLLKHSPNASVTPLELERLAASGLIDRATDTRSGTRYDLASNAPCSTEFALSRFLTPLLAQTGLALFVDADVIFLTDIARLFAEADPVKAVHVVKHALLPEQGQKMDGQAQQSYRRKNWSSVILWNCDHPANRRLTLWDINHRPGRDLHAFYWLHDSEIGELDAGWNWLVSVQPKPERPKIAHYTLGTPELNPDCEHPEYWYEALR